MKACIIKKTQLLAESSYITNQKHYRKLVESGSKFETNDGENLNSGKQLRFMFPLDAAVTESLTRTWCKEKLRKHRIPKY